MEHCCETETGFDFPLIDAHIHPMSDAGSNLAPYGVTACCDELVTELRRNRIGRACGSLIRRGPVNSFEEVAAMNREVVELAARYPDFLIPGIHVHPAFAAESCQELERMHCQGVRWIGELVGYLMGYDDYAGPEFAAIYDLAGQLGMPVNFHCGDLAQIETVARNFPATDFVLAHPGDGEDYRRRLELVTRYPNLYLDLAGTGLFRWGMLRYGIDRAGSHKFLFGTDFPIVNPGMYLQAVLTEHLTREELRQVLCDNFLRLTGLTTG